RRSACCPLQSRPQLSPFHELPKHKNSNGGSCCKRWGSATFGCWGLPRVCTRRCKRFASTLKAKAGRWSCSEGRRKWQLWTRGEMRATPLLSCARSNCVLIPMPRLILVDSSEEFDVARTFDGYHRPSKRLRH